MLEWFKNLNPTVQGAIITSLFGIIGVIIAGLFGLVKKGVPTKNNVTIKQKQGRDSRGTQIGIQNNYNNNTTIQLGDTIADNGTIIFDGGDAFNNGSIRYEPVQSNESEENKNE